jgi:hypothetical protein
VLDRELDVAPTTATRRLHEQVQKDSFPPSDASEAMTAPRAPFSPTDKGTPDEDLASVDSSDTFHETDEEESLRHGLERIRRLQSMLAAVQNQVRQEVEAIEGVLQEGG